MRRPKACIFCSSPTGLSKEHFWPEWLAPYLPTPDPYAHITEFHSAEGKHPVRLQRRSERQGAVNTKKIRAVCATCNNGWMSALESTAKPTILGLLDRSITVLSKQCVADLALWIAVKSIVGEHGVEDTALTPPDDRNAVYSTRSIPDYLRIFIAYHSLRSQAAYHRQSTTVSTTPQGPNPPLPPDIHRNIQATTFLVGSLCIYITAARVTGISAATLDPRHSMHRLWPAPPQDIDFLAIPPLGTDEIFQVGSSLDRLIAHPHVRYGGPLPKGTQNAT